MSSLEKFSEQIYKCIRCGACRAVCPTFGEELSETEVARGRMALAEAVLEGRLDLTKTFERVIFDCALCGACKANCPAGVDVPAIIEAARAELVEQKRSEPVIRFLARRSLKDKKATDKAFALMAVGRAAYGPLAATPLAKYLPYQYKEFKRNFPKIPLKPLGSRLPELSPAEGPKKGRVAFFIGCVINYVYPEMGEAAVRLLNRAGYDVVTARDEPCCGKPLLSLGEVEAFSGVAGRAASLFGAMDVEAVVTACPTCALTLKEDFPKILRGSENAERLSGKVQDINRFLLTNSDILSEASAAGASATYHDPCHLNFGLGIKAEPREIIRAATGGLIEMAESERCCGFGGSFSFLNYTLSGRISARKAANIRATGADMVVSACPGCIMHIQDALTQQGSKARVLHTVQVLDRALKK